MTLAAPPNVAQNLSTTIEPALRLRHLSKRFQVRRGLLATLRRPGYELLWTATRCLVVLGAAATFGFHAHWSRVPEVMAILGLVVATYFGMGMVAGALIIAFRRTAALQTIVIVGSAMFGGVTYPPALVGTALSRYSDAPAWIGRLTEAIPLTYGLRAVRQVTIDGVPFRAVLADVGMLSIFCIVFLTLGSFAMTYALRRARAEGTLSQY